MSEEEKQKLLAGEIEMADIEQRAKEQEIREAQQEVEIKTQAQMAFSQVAGELARMTADEAIDMLPTLDSQMQEFLGEYYPYVTDDVNKLRDDLLRRRQTEVDQQLSRQREQRLREGTALTGGKGGAEIRGDHADDHQRGLCPKVAGNALERLRKTEGRPALEVRAYGPRGEGRGAC